MLFSEELRVNNAGYKRHRAEIDATYPKGRFVALVAGEVVADAESIDAVLARFRELGIDPLKGMVVIAGDDRPEYQEILTPMRVQ